MRGHAQVFGGGSLGFTKRERGWNLQREFARFGVGQHGVSVEQSHRLAALLHVQRLIERNRFAQGGACNPRKEARQ